MDDSKPAPGPDRNKAVSDDVGPSPSPSRDRPANTDDQRVKELEDKVWTLELDNEVKENLLLQAKERGEADRKDLLAYSHHIGQLETEKEHLAKLLEGPRDGQPTAAGDRETPRVAETEVVVHEEEEEESNDDAG